jgi:uncharacterized protein (UPF0333 family)
MESAQPFSRYVKFSPHLYWHVVFPLMLLTLLGLFLYVSYAYPAAGDLARNTSVLAMATNAAKATANAAQAIKNTATKAVAPVRP